MTKWTKAGDGWETDAGGRDRLRVEEGARSQAPPGLGWQLWFMRSGKIAVHLGDFASRRKAQEAIDSAEIKRRLLRL